VNKTLTLILLLLFCGNLSARPKSFWLDSLIGTWVNEKDNIPVFIFNRDHSCTFNFEKESINGIWSYAQDIGIVVTDKDYNSTVFRFVMVDDGGVKDGKLLTKFGLYFCGDTRDINCGDIIFRNKGEIK
jgi:hypothetical protein